MPEADPLSQLAVVVVNFGSPHLLEQGIVEVARDLAPALVVVVDNYSNDEARAAVRRLCAVEGWAGVFPTANLGFGTGCNLGADVALGDGARQLLFLNPDATIDRASAVRLAEATAADEGLLAAPVVRTSDGRPWSVGSHLLLASGDMRAWGSAPEPGEPRLPWVSGACFAISAALWRRVGGFDDRYFLYWEDVDLCARVQARGGRVGIVPEAGAVHDPGQTHTDPGSRAKSSIYYYYNIRNRALFAATWLDPVRSRAWRRSSLRAAWRILLRGGRRQLLHPRSPLTSAWRGLRDGRRLARATAAAAPRSTTDVLPVVQVP